MVDNSEITKEFLKVKEVKVIRIDVIQDTQDEINKYLKNGWSILNIEKKVWDDGGESIYYHLGQLET